MNHALKAAGGGLFDQYASYVNPRYPVVPELIDSVAAFACRLTDIRPTGH